MKNVNVVVNLGLVLSSAFLLTGCGAAKLDKNSKNSLGIEREYQRIVRRDCNDNVISDKVETVKSPTAWVEIEPADRYRVWSSSFRNVTTNSSAAWIVEYSKFQVDYSSGALNMNVQLGDNSINYKFYECVDIAPPTTADGAPTCRVPLRVIEEGFLALHINYSEKYLDGYQEIVVCDKSKPEVKP